MDNAEVVNVGAQGTALLKRALVDGTPALLDAAIERLRVAVRECLREDVNALAWRANLGAALRTRYERTGEPRDLSEAISVLREVVAGTSATDPAVPGRLGNLGVALWDRYLAWGDEKDLDEAIEVLVDAAAKAAASPLLAHQATNLGNALADRFELRRDPGDLDQAVSWQRRAVEAEGTSVSALANLAAVLHTRFESRRNATDLEEALTAAKAAVAASGPEHPKRPPHLSTVGVLYHVRYEQAGALADLEDAIAALTESDRLSAWLGSAARAACLTALGNCYRARYLRLGTTTDLDAAIEAHRAAVACTARDAIELPGRLSNLAVALDDRYPPGDLPGEPDEALRLHEEAVRLSGDGHPQLLSIITNHGRGLLTRFDRYGVVADCSAAIANYRRALLLAGAEHPDRPRYLALLGLALRSRHGATGHADNIHEAVAALREAVEATLVGNPHRATFCSYLGSALRARYVWYGERADLDEAIEWHEAAVVALPNSHAQRSSVLAQRANALRFRAEHTRSAVDVAVEACRQALDAETDDALLPLRLAQLGAALDLRDHSRENLDETIDVRREVCRLCRPDNSYRGLWLSDLANSLRDRAKLTGDDEDLDEAHRLHLEAVEVTKPAHPEYATVLSNLAGSFRDRFVRHRQQVDLTATFDHLRQVTELTTAPAVRRFVAARTWAHIAAQTEQSESAGMGYATAVSLLPIAAWHGVDRSTREQLLRESRWLASDAAACALELDDPGQAVELLERGRAVQWTQRLAMATDLDRVRVVAPGIAQRLEHARAVLDGHREAELAGYTNDMRIRAAAEWDAAVAELHKHPEAGLAELFAPAHPITEQLRLSPLPGTVVVINVSGFRCDAILLDAHGIRFVGLTKLRLSELGDNIAAYFGSLGVLSDPTSTDPDRSISESVLVDVLQWLWDTVASPVLDMVLPGERVWWCPTGPLTYLPLHAAGQVPDRTVSSYTPTIGALLRARARTVPPSTPRVVGVAVGDAPGMPPLPGASGEIAQLRTQLHGIATVTPLEGPQASRDRVRQALTKHTWAHLACHGEQVLANPSQAALVLSDGRLHLTEISARSEHHAEGAYLSACQTALGGVELSDEALHLAAALQYAGFRRVIGTLWSVSDATARPVARRIYATLAANGSFQPERSADAVTEVTRWLRTRYPDSPSRWAPYVHIGP